MQLLPLTGTEKIRPFQTVCKGTWFERVVFVYLYFLSLFDSEIFPSSTKSPQNYKTPILNVNVNEKVSHGDADIFLDPNAIVTIIHSLTYKDD